MPVKQHTHFADVNILVRVYFTDDGDNDLRDQAFETIDTDMTLHFGDNTEESGREIVGKVQEIEP